MISATAVDAFPGDWRSYGESMPVPPQAPEALDLDAVDAVLAVHHGDPRAAIAGLIDDIEYLCNQIAYALLAVSRRYTRGWLPAHERMIDE